MYTILNILRWSVVVCILGTMLVFANAKQKGQRYYLDNIEIYKNMDYSFLDQNMVISYLNDYASFEDKKIIDQVLISDLENKLNMHPIIKKAEVFASLIGEVNIRLEQREPLVRVQSLEQDYYLDKNGSKMPLSQEYTPRLIVASGEISANHYKSLLKIAHFISNDSLWKAQVIQVYINHDQDFVLIPRVGSHKIILGDSDSLDNKFGKLLLFYKNVLSLKGWNNYSEINLKFNNQIVCTKK